MRLVVGVGLSGLFVVFGPDVSEGQGLLQGGPPVQVRPAVPEVGLTLLPMTPGTPNAFGGLGTPPGGGLPGGGSGSGGPASAMATMLGTSWGAQAVAAAESIGVNPSVLAGTCQIESGCRNVNNGNAVGPFQMFPAAFSEGIQVALARNPSLASQIVQGPAGRSDPFTNAVASAGYQLKASEYLERRGVEAPTGLDMRGFYNFGQRYAAEVAQADSAETMGSVLARAPPNWFPANGISPQMTVGEWREKVIQGMGGSAGQAVRI